MTPDDTSQQVHGWFGTPWNGCLREDGTVDEARHIPVPVGNLCGWCQDPIAATDSGQDVPSLSEAPAVAQYWHRECLLRAVVGGLDHLAGRCTCCSPSGNPDNLGSLAAGMSAHQEALAIDEHLFRHGI